MDWAVDRVGYDFGPAWTGGLQALADAAAWVGWAVLLLIAAVAFATSWSTVVRRRRLWCPVNRRDAEVALAEEGWQGFRRPVAVTACSVFERPTCVTCRRGCLHAPRRPLLELARRG